METKTTQRISEKNNWFFETINKLVVCIKMWDTPLYAVNMFITLVNNEVLSTYGRAEYS